jgi:hypothetical protein
MCQPGRPGPQGDSQKGSPCFSTLPQGKVEGVLLDGLCRCNATAGPRLHVVQLAAREFAVAVKLADGVVDIPIGGVGVAFRSSSLISR